MLNYRFQTYVTKITFIKWIEPAIIDMRRDIYIYVHKKTKLPKNIKRFTI